MSKACHRLHGFCYGLVRVSTEIECAGSVTINLRPARIVLLDVETVLGWEKSLAAWRDDAVMVFSSPCRGLAPCKSIVVANELVGLVFTALMKIFLPSAE